ncbi:MAG: DUF6531 domain-containing protein, partial [Ignavibacteriales bacterium]
MKIFKGTFIKTMLLSALLILTLQTSAFALTDEELLQMESHINGDIIQRQVNGTNKPQFNSRKNISENIDPVSGSLTIKETDFSLPGKDGLNLDITRMYNSLQAEYGTKGVKLLYSRNLISPEYDTGWYINVNISDASSGNSLGTFCYGIFDTYSEAYDLYAYFSNSEDPDYIYQPELPQYGTKQMSELVDENYMVNHVDKYNYLHSRYDLGAGWSFGFPSIEKVVVEDESDKLYYHDGQGAAYKIYFKDDPQDPDYSNLKDYPSKDVKLSINNEGYDANSYNNEYATYKFVDADKRATYFSEDGRILQVKDRFGNTIKFKYVQRRVHSKNYKYISQITDTVGRTVDFTYSVLNTSDRETQNETLTITIHDPSNTKTQQVVYTKDKQEIQYYTSYGSSSQDSEINFYEPRLASVTNQIGEVTNYLYGNSPGNTDWSGIAFRCDTKEVGASGHIIKPSISP